LATDHNLNNSKGVKAQTSDSGAFVPLHFPISHCKQDYLNNLNIINFVQAKSAHTVGTDESMTASASSINCCLGTDANASILNSPASSDELVLNHSSCIDFADFLWHTPDLSAPQAADVAVRRIVALEAGADGEGRNHPILIRNHENLVSSGSRETEPLLPPEIRFRDCDHEKIFG
jgi:hypothetical protein